MIMLLTCPTTPGAPLTIAASASTRPRTVKTYPKNLIGGRFKVKDDGSAKLQELQDEINDNENNANQNDKNQTDNYSKKPSSPSKKQTSPSKAAAIAALQQQASELADFFGVHLKAKVEDPRLLRQLIREATAAKSKEEEKETK